MRMCVFGLVLMMLVGCQKGEMMQSAVVSQSVAGEIRPLVGIYPVEDLALSSLSSQASRSFTQQITERLEGNDLVYWSLLPRKYRKGNTSTNEHFRVTMQLIQYAQSPDSPSELSIGVHLKILDVRNPIPQVILQEVVSHTTLLKKPLKKGELIAAAGATERSGPIGLAHAKLTREIATRIEDYALLRIKG